MNIKGNIKTLKRGKKFICKMEKCMLNESKMAVDI